MEKNIYGTSAPHIRAHMTAEKIMLYILAALLPAGLHGIYCYGWNAGAIILATVTSALIGNFLLRKIMKKQGKLLGLQMLVTALILSYTMPSAMEWKLGLAAGAICAIIVNLSFHFFNKNILSPVIVTRLFMMLVFSQQLQSYAYDGVSEATPLAVLKAEGTVDTLAMIFGRTGGCVGESSAILLCLGAIFLIMMGLIDFRVCGMYLFSFSACLAVFGGHGLSSYYLTAQLAGGGFMLALWFIAPAYSHLPITKGGRWIYGLELGILTAVFRLLGPGAENLCYAFLIADLSIPILEKLTIPRAFGIEKGSL